MTTRDAFEDQVRALEARLYPDRAHQQAQRTIGRDAAFVLSAVIVRLVIVTQALFFTPVAAQVRLRFVAPPPPVVVGDNPIAAARLPPANTWETAGATIVARAVQCGSTIAAGASAGTIQTAMSNCSGTNQYVHLGTGTFNLSTGVDITGRNVTLRGDGADLTKLVFSGNTGCNFSVGAGLCIRSGENVYGPNGSGFNTATWSAGYAQGDTSVTLSSKTNLAVGQILMLDQLDDASDGYPAAGDIYLCESCSKQGGNNFGRTGRSQIHVVTVTSIPGTACPCAIGISPGLVAPNWRSARTPQAWWGSTLVPTGVGIENLSVDVTSSGSPPIMFFNVTNSWIKGVRSIENANPVSTFSHVRMMNVNRITVRDSYFFGPVNQTTDTYGITAELASGVLIENNIMDCNPGPFEHNGADMGSVWAYNYGDRNCSWANTIIEHEAGPMLNLYEGNDGTGVTADIIHGSTQLETFFRNHWSGPVAGITQSTRYWLQSYHRVFNIVGDVAGDSGNSTYERSATTQSGAEIYSLGENASDASGAGSPSLDANVKTRLFRWGVWDDVTSTNNGSANDTTGISWNSAEVPTALTNFAQSVPATHALPNSMYLSAKPAFFFSLTWPPIGPDVTSGDISNSGGHAYRNPARVCRETMIDDPGYAGTTIRVFSTASCPYLGL